jgi:hypothetical protein
MATVVREFGGVLTAAPGGPWGPAEARLAGALAALEIGRTAVADLLLADPRNQGGLWELNAALVTAVDRMLDELGPAPAGSPPPVRRPEAAQGS